MRLQHRLATGLAAAGINRKDCDRDMRKLIAILIFFVFITAYIVLIASFSGAIAALPVWFQPVIYIVAGIAWIFPLRPLFRWMNSGPGNP